MSRYIDADALIEAMTKFSNATGEDMTHGIFYAHIAPTIEAEPVRHGKWIIRDNPGTGWYRITCSECGEDVTATAPCIGFFPNAKVIWNYCPECGARMDEE